MSKIQKPRLPKRKHKYYARKPNNRSIDVHMKGFLCSCNNNEKDCVKESYNLLNKYADVLYPPENKTEVDKEDIDIGDELKSELTDLTSNKTHWRFQVVDSGAKNIIFIKTTLKDPVELAEKIVSDIAETKTKQTRTLLRLIPIEVICKAYLNDIETAFKKIASKYFTDTPKAFSIVYNHRNNDSLNRDEVIKTVADVVFASGQDHKVNLKEAEVTVVIEVIRGFALIGVAPNFIKYKKYNLHAVADQEGQIDQEQKGGQTSENN